MPASPLLIETQTLTFRFGRRDVLHELDLRVPAGSIYGFLGPNGAGKSTTLRLLLGLLRPASGTVRLFGHALHQHREALLSQVGALIESPSLYGHLSGHDNVEATRRLRGLPAARTAAVLAQVGLSADAHRPAREYSMGMRQRLGLALALLPNPPLLILDEPTNGLDPQGIAEVRGLVQRLAAEGKTIILASHLLDEIEKVCTHVAVLQRGELRAAGPVGNILATADRVLLRPEAGMAAATVQQALAALPWVTDVRPETEGVVSAALAPGHGPADLNRALFAQNIVLAGLELRHRSLEAQFLELTK